MAKSKADKSAILTTIIESIRESSPTSGIFVKEEEDTCPHRSGGENGSSSATPSQQRVWWEVDESFGTLFE